MTDRTRPRGRWQRRRTVAAALAALLFAVLALGLTPLAAADSRPSTPEAPSPVPAPVAQTATTGVAGVDWHGQVAAALANRGTVVQFGKDARIDAGEQADAVVALGGDVTVNGTVQAAVAVGGDITVNGTVEKTCVAIGGDVKLRRTAVVGSRLADKDDAAVVLVGGQLIRDAEAQLSGSTTSVHGEWFTNAFRWGVWDPVVNPFSIGSFLGWLIQSIVVAVLAIIAVAVAPRQVRAVSQTLRRRALASLGWGALTAIIIVPVSIVLLAITVIGLLIVVPGVILGVPLFGLFSFLCLSVFVGIQVLGGSERYRGNLILAAVIGVAIVNVVRLIPFVGGFIVAVATLIAFGAVVLSIADWQRRRREVRRLARAGAAQGPQPPAPGAPPSGGAPYGAPPLPPTPPAAQTTPMASTGSSSFPVATGPEGAVYAAPAVPGSTATASTGPEGAVYAAPAAAGSPPDASITAAAPGAAAVAPPGELTVAPAPDAGSTPYAAEPLSTETTAPADAATTALMTAKLPVPDAAASATGPAEPEPAAAASAEADVTPLEAPPAPPAEPAAAPPEEGTGSRPQEQA